mmetsp:Transcript_44573/g.123505  ORF Transcript_44573/g.123505 Transcript_44573/m.123505 type:complete len:120 (-) Transcript_44573:363-722(-)
MLTERVPALAAPPSEHEESRLTAGTWDNGKEPPPVEGPLDAAVVVLQPRLGGLMDVACDAERLSTCAVEVPRAAELSSANCHEVTVATGACEAHAGDGTATTWYAAASTTEAVGAVPAA